MAELTLMQGLMLASTAVSTVSAIQQGKYSQQAAELEAQQYRDDAALARIQATEESNDIKREFFDMKASNIAYFAAKTGADPSESASFLALNRANMETRDRDIGAVRLVGASQQRKYGLSVFSSQMSGKAAKIGSYGKASSSLLSGYTSYKTVTT